MFVQGRSPPARRRTWPAERTRLAAAVPRPRPRRAHPWRSHAGALRNFAQRRRHRRRGDEIERTLLQDLAKLRRAAAGAQRGRDGRRAHLRIYHRHPRRGIAGRHDRRLGEAALRPAGKTREPHHQRSERREPLRPRHHQQAPGDDRVGVTQMKAIDKGKALRLIGQQLEAIPALRKQSVDSMEFKKWSKTTDLYVEKVFGSGSTNSKTFEAITFWPTD